MLQRSLKKIHTDVQQSIVIHTTVKVCDRTRAHYKPHYTVHLDHRGKDFRANYND